MFDIDEKIILLMLGGKNITMFIVFAFEEIKFNAQTLIFVYIYEPFKNIFL